MGNGNVVRILLGEYHTIKRETCWGLSALPGRAGPSSQSASSSPTAAPWRSLPSRAPVRCNKFNIRKVCAPLRASFPRESVLISSGVYDLIVEKFRLCLDTQKLKLVVIISRNEQVCSFPYGAFIRTVWKCHNEMCPRIRSKTYLLIPVMLDECGNTRTGGSLGELSGEANAANRVVPTMAAAVGMASEKASSRLPSVNIAKPIDFHSRIGSWRMISSLSRGTYSPPFSSWNKTKRSIDCSMLRSSFHV